MHTVRRMHEIDLTSFEAGTKTWIQLVPEDVSADFRGSLVAIVRGAEPGPVGYFGAGTHGDELNSIESVRRVALSLDPATVTGTVVLAVAHNLNSFDAHVRVSPLDDKNPDHCFPGKSDGSPTEVLAHTLFTQLVSKADYVLDMHCASRGGWNPLYSVVFGDTREVAEGSAELAGQFGSIAVLDVQKEEGKALGSSIGSALDNNLFVQSALQGRPSAIIEFGGSAQLTQSQIDLGVAGILNVLRSRGQLSDAAPTMYSPLVTQNAATLHSPDSGFLALRKRSGDPVVAGEKVGVLKLLFGGVVDLESPVTGVILRTAAEATVAQGDRVVTVAGAAS